MKRLALLSVVVMCSCGSEKFSFLHGGSYAAIVNSDYHSTSIDLLDVTTRTIAKAECITSGTKLGPLSAALSGDVVLPSQPQANHELVLIDRTNYNLTFVDPNDCTPRLQMSVGNFKANPHDIASISPTKAYVTRYNGNDTPTGTLDRGYDILVINPEAGTITDSINLSYYATNPNVQPRPDRIWVVGSTAYVSLGEISEDYQTTGPGRIIAVDTGTDAVTDSIDLPTLMGCSQLTADSNGLAVACGGDSNNPNDLSLTAVAFVSLAGETQQTLTAATAGGSPMAASLIVPLGDQGYLTGTWGNFSGNDAIWSYSAATQKASSLGNSPGAYELGTGLYDPNSLTAFISEGDATTPRIRVFDVAGGIPTESSAVPSGASTGLPPRAISPL